MEHVKDGLPQWMRMTWPYNNGSSSFAGADSHGRQADAQGSSPLCLITDDPEAVAAGCFPRRANAWMHWQYAVNEERTWLGLALL